MKYVSPFKIKYDHDYILIAVISTLQDYQFAYHLNKYPLFLFKRMEKDISYVINEHLIYFSAFKHLNSELQRSVFIIQNKCMYTASRVVNKGLFTQDSIANTAFLIPELKEFDYLIKFVGIWKNSELLHFSKFLKNINSIESQTNVSLSKLKSINNLVF